MLRYTKQIHPLGVSKGGDMKTIYEVQGMTCSACSSAVEKAVSGLDGVENVSVNLLTNTMVVSHDGRVDDKVIHESVSKLGYSASSPTNKDGDKPSGEENEIKKSSKDMKTRMLVSFAFMVPLMYIAMGEMLGLAIPGFFKGPENSLIFAFSQMLMTLPIIYVNRSYYINGFKTLIRANPNMDSLIALGSSAAFFYGVFVIYRLAYGLGHGDLDLVHSYMHSLYFESAAMILTLITFGKYLEARSKARSTDAIKSLMDLSPKKAIRVQDGLEVEVPIEEVQVGDILVVKPGGAIPVDGKVIKGRASIDQSAITGEPIPVDVGEGSAVIGSTILTSGWIQIRAEKVGEDTSLAQIINLVKDANASKAPIAKLADKIAGVFVPLVMAIALISSLIWILLGQSFEFALTIGISVLVISCPCALGLATPVSIMVGTGKGARNGILIKSAEALERLHEVDVIMLDKTGTISLGRPRVTDIIAKEMDRDEFIGLIASMEAPSDHPLSKAIVDHAKEISIAYGNPDIFNNIGGKGIEVGIGGRTYYGGNLGLMEEVGINTQGLRAEADRLSSQGKTVMYFADKKKVLGLVGVADPIKPDSKEAIDKLKEMGLDVYMVTGDNEITAKTLAGDLGLDKVFAQVLPQDKDRIVRQVQDQGKRVAMVGDGINDGPALARADVGLAIGAGTDVAIDAADIVLVRSSLVDVVNAIGLSVATIKNIKQNLFWAFFYNILLIPLAGGILYKPLGIVLNPMLASAAMSFSSVFVVTNALRLNKYKPILAREIKEIKSGQLGQGGKNKESEEVKLMEEKIFYIEGMACGHCSARVEKVLNEIEGVEASVDLENKLAKVRFNQEISQDRLEEAIVDAGYQVIGVD